MIKGLRIKVTSKELASHLKARAEHHKARAAEKEATLPELRRMLEAVAPNRAAANVGAMNKSMSSYNFNSDEPADQLERDIRDHNNKSLAFSYLADHQFDEDYDLEQSDLVRLEILKG